MGRLKHLWKHLTRCRHRRSMESVDRYRGWWLMECNKCGHLARYYIGGKQHG